MVLEVNFNHPILSKETCIEIDKERMKTAIVGEDGKLYIKSSLTDRSINLFIL